MQARRPLRRFGSFICGVILSGTLLGASIVDAATYYVATTGSDSNAGTEASPFRTIKKGVQALKPGDTLYIKNGTYAESLVNVIPSGASWSNPITVASFPGHKATLKPPAGSTYIIASYDGKTKQYVIVKDLILDGNGDTKIGIGLGSGSSRFRVIGVEVKSTTNTGINIDTDFHEFINVRVHNTGLSGSGHGFYYKGKYGIVEGSEIFNNQKCGIQFYRVNVGGVDGNIFRNNRVYNNGLNPSASNSCTHGLFVGSGKDTLVYNNIFYGGKNGPAITISAGASNARIYNNTIYNNYRGIQINGGNPIIRNNIVYQNTNGNIVTLSGTPTLSHNLTSNPLFIDHAKNNFQLQAASPAINAGVTLSEVKDDHVKVPRPQGSAPDIGAFEYTSSTSTPAVSAPANLRMTNAK